MHVADHPVVLDWSISHVPGSLLRAVTLETARLWRNTAMKCETCSPLGEPGPRYLITGIGGRCARAASGHAAVPPSSLRNWRRLMEAYPKPRDHRLTIASLEQVSGVHGNKKRRRMSGLRQLLQIDTPAPPAQCPLYPQ